MTTTDDTTDNTPGCGCGCGDSTNGEQVTRTESSARTCQTDSHEKCTCPDCNRTADSSSEACGCDKHETSCACSPAAGDATAGDAAASDARSSECTCSM